jgi:ABC-type glycerol-3-phosphate transport system permease component
MNEPRVLTSAPALRTGRLGQRHRKMVFDAGAYIVLIPLSLLVLFPFFWMLVTSFKPLGEVRLWPPTILPQTFTFSNYQSIWQQYPFANFLENGFIIAALSTVGALISCTFAAFALARLRFAGREALFLVVLGTIMLPYPARMIPIFIEMTKVHWINTFYPLIVPAFFGNAYGIFLLRQFFKGIPHELMEAATIDGCSPPGVLLRIYVPLSKSALTALAVVTFITSWNDLIPPLIFINDPSKMPIAVGLAFFKGQGEALWSWLMAASTLSVLPLLIIYIFAQRFIIEGMTYTGLKR